MRLSGGLLLFAAVALATAAQPAQAAYPGANGRIFFQGCGDECPHFDIYSVNPDGTELHNLTEALTSGKGPPDNAFQPSVSGDGKLVVFGVDTQAAAEIWIMNADGSDPVQLTKDKLLDQEPAISADGSRIAWNQWSPEGAFTDPDIWVMGSDGSSPELLFNGPGTDTFPQFTRDGQTIVMTSETGDRDIRKIPSIPAMPPLTVSTGLAADDELVETDPSISPSSQRVAFAQAPTSSPLGPFDIYTVGIEGGATTPLFDDPTESETSPAYSPDGTKIAFELNGLPMIGNADGSGAPVPLDVGSLISVSALEWAPALAPPGGGPGPNPGGGPPGPPDTTPPQTKIRRAPKNKLHGSKATFRFTSSEPNSTFRCRLDHGKAAPCGSPKTYRHLRAGEHRFAVFAIDAAGNRDPSPAKRRFTVVEAGD